MDKQLEDELLEILNNIVNADGFFELDKDTILNEGLIDSLDIMHCINDIEHKYNIVIYGRETGLTKDDCANIHALAAFVQKKLDAKASA